MRTYRKATKSGVTKRLGSVKAHLPKRRYSDGFIKHIDRYPGELIGEIRVIGSRLYEHPGRSDILKSNLKMICVAYLLLITSAELLTTYDAKLGIALHITILFGLLLYAAIEYDKSKVRSHFLISLIIAPIIRILSLSMPVIYFGWFFWFLLISIPIFISVFTCMWLLGIHPKDIGLAMPCRRDVPVEVGVILIAVPFGIMEYLILKPSPLNLSLELPNFIALTLIMLICTGFLEEISFRGLIQFTTQQVMSKWGGILFVSTVFGVLHVGNLTFLDCLLAFSAGFLFSVVREKTGSIYGISISHGIINIILFLLAPFYF
ncbi:MAG: type II CAAX endopeptidase family protein [Halobacteriota archaeon]